MRRPPMMPASRPDPAAASLPVCPGCGADTLAGASFCDRCGRRLSRAAHAGCMTCGAPLQAGAGFCDTCGAAVPLPAGTAGPGERPASRRRALGVLAGSIAALVAMAGLATLVGGQSGGQPQQVLEPAPPAVASETMAYLAGPGTVLERRHGAEAAVVALTDRPEARECQAAQQSLEGAGSAEDALRAIQGVPDPILRELLVGELAAGAGALEACGPSSGDLLRQRLAEAKAFHEAVAARRTVLSGGTGR